MHMPPASLLLVLAMVAAVIAVIANRRRRQLRQRYWTPSPGEPDWFDWPMWGLAIGSDQRFKPRGERERCAYVAGLRDAARIIEANRWRPIPGFKNRTESVEGSADMRRSIKAIHAYVLDFLGLPAKVQSDNWSDDA